MKTICVGMIGLVFFPVVIILLMAWLWGDFLHSVFKEEYR